RDPAASCTTRTKRAGRWIGRPRPASTPSSSTAPCRPTVSAPPSRKRGAKPPGDRPPRRHHLDRGRHSGIDGVEHGAPWTADWLAPGAREDYRKAIREQGGMKARILWLERLHVQGPEVVAAVDTLARHHVAVDPTLIAYVTKLRGDDPQYIASSDFKHVPAPMMADWKKGTFVSDWTADDFRRAHAVWPKLLQLVK